MVLPFSVALIAVYPPQLFAQSVCSGQAVPGAHVLSITIFTRDTAMPEQAQLL